MSDKKTPSATPAPPEVVISSGMEAMGYLVQRKWEMTPQGVNRDRMLEFVRALYIEMELQRRAEMKCAKCKRLRPHGTATPHD